MPDPLFMKKEREMAIPIKKSKNSPFILLVILLEIVFTCGILISLFASEEGETYPFPEDPLKGSKLFVSKGCIKCHSIWGTVIASPTGRR